jgi:hypothetical protein
MQIDKKELEALDLSDVLWRIRRPEYQAYFEAEPGREHYRLLMHLGSMFYRIVEIGSLYGYSALALGANGARVTSYDIADQVDVDAPDNIEFRLQKSTEIPEFDCDLVFVDAGHDGVYEWAVYQKLIKDGFVGISVWDDIHLPGAMAGFWAKVDLPKHDLTSVGHYTGTGVIFHDV